jgi:hypothetical protein
MGCGVIYKLTLPPSGRTTWSQFTLLNFDGPYGAFPEGGLIRDTAGNLYGTVGRGVQWNSGVAFKLSPPKTGQTRWTETVLHNFYSPTSGDEPVGELIGGPTGHICGVANDAGVNGGGTVIEIVLRRRPLSRIETIAAGCLSSAT